MASTISFGDANAGFQAGIIQGPVNTTFYLPPERQEIPACPSAAIPFSRDPDFVDRGTLLDQIREKCEAPASRRIALVGLGGVGKSQLAIEHCYRTVDESPETWVFWVHASNAARIEQGYRDIADQVRLASRNDPQADVFRLVHNWLRNEKNGKWLLVLDSADNAAGLQLLKSRLPWSKNGSVLVTSRATDVALQLVEGSDILSIEPMDDTSGPELLRKKLGEGMNRDRTTELARALEFMPLALVQAAAYIRQRAPRCSVQQYLEEFHKSDSKRTSLLNYEGGHLRRDVEAKNSILITWQISFDHILQARQSAAELLSLMSFFDPQGIPEYVLWNSITYEKDEQDDQRRKSCRDGDRDDTNDRDYDDYDSPSESGFSDEFDDDVLILQQYMLISVNLGERTFEMHSLVQLAVRSWLKEHGTLERWKEQFIHCLYVDFPAGHFENWARCQTLFPHVRSAIAQQPNGRNSLKKWALLLSNAAGYAMLRGNGADAEIMLSKAKQTTRDIFGPESEEYLNSMVRMGLVYGQRDQWGKAKELFEQVMETCKKKFGKESQEALVSMTNVASTYKSQGLWGEAEKLEEEVMETRKRVLGREHSDTLASMTNLAWTYNKQGRFKEAKKLDRQAATARNRMLDRSHASSTMTMDVLPITKRE